MGEAYEPRSGCPINAAGACSSSATSSSETAAMSESCRPAQKPWADASGNLWWEQRRMGGVAERSEVKSGDGGSIAVWVVGDGPPLVLVHGSVCDHTVFAPLVGELRDEFTIFAMDRRGFG